MEIISKENQTIKFNDVWVTFIQNYDGDYTCEHFDEITIDFLHHTMTRKDGYTFYFEGVQNISLKVGSLSAKEVKLFGYKTLSDFYKDYPDKNQIINIMKLGEKNE